MSILALQMNVTNCVRLPAACSACLFPSLVFSSDVCSLNVPCGEGTIDRVTANDVYIRGVPSSVNLQ